MDGSSLLYVRFEDLNETDVRREGLDIDVFVDLNF